MNLEPCFLCARPVLELCGQFAKLDTYNLERGDPALAEGAFGWCHLLCLSRSRWGPFWSDRICDRLIGRGYVALARSPTLTALEFHRTGDVIVLRTDGARFATTRGALKKTRTCAGGVLVDVDEQMNIELDDDAAVERIRTALTEDGRFSLVELVSLLGLDSVMMFPDALREGALCYDRSLRRHWQGRWISARASYAQFIPSEVLAMLTR